MKKIKINYDNLKKMTSILLENIDSELKKGYKSNEKIALFYLNINDREYYYFYNFLNKTIEELYDQYRIVDIKKAKSLLVKQMEG